MSKSTITASESLPPESRTDSYPTHRFSAISEHSQWKGTPTHLRAWLMSSQPDSLASRSASQDSAAATRTNETCGRQRSTSFAEYDRDTRCWRTSQVSLLTLTPDEYTETWPKAGLMLSGVAYPLPSAERRISEIDGFAWPSPAANEPGWKHIPIVDKNGNPPTHPNQRFYHAETGRVVQKGLEQIVKMWPTPDANRRGASPNFTGERPNGAKEQLTLETAVGSGKLNPMWVEWLMGWPLGWTAVEPLETDKFQQWCERHGVCSPTVLERQ